MFKPRIGIIGGKGRMGRWFERLFKDTGHEVLISDVDTELKGEDLTKECHVIIFALPMEVFPQVVKELGPKIPEESFMTDICSLKEKQVKVMLENSVCEVCGTHPLFGPGEKDLKGLRVALCPSRGQRWYQWWKEFLIENGALVAEFTPQEHDRTMAWVQALNHFILLCLGKSLEEDGINFEHVLKLATPSFERQLNIVARLCLQDPELYATIQLGNPYTKTAVNTFTKHARDLKKILDGGDREGFLKIFKEVQELGPTLLKYCRKGL